jgi:hypothetical protein
MTESMVRLVLWLEKRVEPILGRLFGFRLLLVIEKGYEPDNSSR